MGELRVREICNVYRATETYGNASVTDAHDPPEVRCRTQGRPLPGMTLKFVDPESGKPLRAGEVGTTMPPS